MPFSTPAPIDDANAAALDEDPSVPPPTVDVLGVPLALTDYDRTMDWMDATIRMGGKGYVCVAATHTVVATQDDAELHAAVTGASLVVPDGQPVVWAMNALGHDLTHRVYGPDLMAKYCERSALTGARMFLYGGRNQGALVQLALNLRHRFAGVQIVGGYAPPFRTLSDEELDAVVAEINHAKPDVVWVGIGVPKQEKWMAALRDRLDAPVLVGVGAAFDFHAGLVPQAPAWMQAAGLEWLFRLSKEPRRLWRRYLTYNPRFVLGFARQFARHRRAGRAR
ncbi:MAG TPA: WecB/TagA/CpsF family glycosyltransferase [Baekduia sp.]|nr:WecB/TagA/CpsF family glycosyltransferase [Baekduia sp.]